MANTPPIGSWKPSTSLASVADYTTDLAGAEREAESLRSERARLEALFTAAPIGSPEDATLAKQIADVEREQARIARAIARLEQGREGARAAEDQAKVDAHVREASALQGRLRSAASGVDKLQRSLAEALNDVAHVRREFLERFGVAAHANRTAEVDEGRSLLPLQQSDDFLSPGRIRLTSLETGEAIWPR